MLPSITLPFAVSVATWPLFASLGILLGGLLGIRQANDSLTEGPLAPVFGLWVVAGAFAFGKLIWLAIFAASETQTTIATLGDRGFSEHGALLGAALAGSAYLRFRGLPVRIVGDCMAPYLALTQSLVRVGCFLNGCCWGAQSNLPWAVPSTFATPVSTSATQVYTHPVQLYLAGGLFALFIWTRARLRRAAFSGEIVLIYLSSFALIRIVTDFFRGDVHVRILGMTATQAISIPVLVVPLALIFGSQHARYFRQSK